MAATCVPGSSQSPAASRSIRRDANRPDRRTSDDTYRLPGAVRFVGAVSAVGAIGSVRPIGDTNILDMQSSRARGRAYHCSRGNPSTSQMLDVTPLDLRRSERLQSALELRQSELRIERQKL